LKKKKNKPGWMASIGLLTPVTTMVLIPSIRSRVAKKVLSTYQNQRSLFHEEGMKISIPDGKSTPKKDWARVMTTLNADRKFSRFIKAKARLTILYNFGYFPIYKRQSSFYDPNSPYYTSFYGGYGIRRKSGNPYGFTGNALNTEEVVQVLKFDVTRLVLRFIGKKNAHFDYGINGIKKVRLFGEPDWYRIDGIIETNGAYHQHSEKLPGLIQYGKPPKLPSGTEEYPLIKLIGRIYMKYDRDKDLTLAFYCLCRENQVIEDWEKNILAETVIIEKS
jgi:hypothetical protein